MDKNGEKNGSVEISINPETTPILYTDNINITVNGDGVVLDVAQRVGGSKQVRIVSRIGMSKEHAKKFVDAMGKIFLMTDTKEQSGKEKTKN